MKIYTKTGDKGETSLLGGKRVPKCDLRIDAYGTVDELNSWIGLINDQEVDEKYKNILTQIQECLFTIGSSLASDPEKSQAKIPEMNEGDILLLEEEIDDMNYVLPELKYFILPGGHPFVSYCHIARSVCRRAERLIVQLSLEDYVDELIIKYINRLSDYLFVLARKLCADLGIEEKVWKTR